MALIKVLAVSRPVREKYSQQPGGKYNGVQLVCTLHPGAQERDRGPVLTLLCPATRSMRATAYAAATSIDGHQSPTCPAWETTLVGVQILWGRWGQCLTQVCPTQTRVRSLGQTRHDGVQWLANEMMAISSGALCKAHTLHKRQQHGLWQNFLSHPAAHTPPDETMMACFAFQLPSP